MSLVPSFSLAGYVGAAALVIGLGGGYFLNNNIKDKEIAEIKTEQAIQVSKQYEQAMENLKAAAKNINEQAVAAKGEYAEYLAAKPNLQDLKNAKTKPLPAGCAPDDKRMQYLAKATAAANAAITGPKPSRAMPSDSKPAK